MSFLAALVIASWFLAFWKAAISPDHSSGAGTTWIAVWSSVALGVWTLLG